MSSLPDLPDGEEKPPIPPPTPPKRLRAAGLELWQSMTDQYGFHAADLAILKQASATVDEIDMLEQSIAELGPMIPGSRGQLRLHPAFQQLATHRATVDRLLLSLGIPADGERVGRRRSPQAKAAVNTRYAKQPRKGRMSSVAPIVKGDV
jgi:hypothetical protein